MGHYNTLFVESICTSCYSKTTLKIQFMYGEIWDHIYRLGDELLWGLNNVGEQGEKHVVIDGEAEECDSCGETVDYLIFVEDDVIKSIRQNDGEYHFFGTDGFIVLKQ